MNLKITDRKEIAHVLRENPAIATGKPGGYYDLVEVLRSITENEEPRGCLERFERTLDEMPEELALVIREVIQYHLFLLTQEHALA